MVCINQYGRAFTVTINLAVIEVYMQQAQALDVVDQGDIILLHSNVIIRADNIRFCICEPVKKVSSGN